MHLRNLFQRARAVEQRRLPRLGQVARDDIQRGARRVTRDILRLGGDALRLFRRVHEPGGHGC